MRAVVIFAFLSFFAVGANAQSKTGPSIKFDHLEYDFGKIKQGDKVQHEFRFTSNGTDPLVITQAQGSCGCTVPDYPKQPLKKGEKGVIKVTFDSAGKMGSQDKTVTVMSNSTGGAVVLHIKGVIEAAPLKNTPESRPMEKPQN
ncbi:MAG: DUF1573 domain-containing protein [Bacteroidota bacterium]